MHPSHSRGLITSLPPGYTVDASGDATHPLTIHTLGGYDIAAEDEQQAHGLAWRIYTEALTEIPDPCPVPVIRAMCEMVGSQRAAAHLLHVDARTMRKWACAERSPPWAAMELLRRLIAEQTYKWSICAEGTHHDNTTAHQISASKYQLGRNRR